MCIYIVKHNKLLPPPSERELFQEHVISLQKGEITSPLEIWETHLHIPLWLATANYADISDTFKSSEYYIEKQAS